MVRFRKNAFTLIELLIVVAIIAILAAIAVPNFLEAQIRAKVSRVKNDMRSVNTALEAYVVDNNKYPVGRVDFANPIFGFYPLSAQFELTTPIAYMSSVSFEDPFFPTKGAADTVTIRRPIYYFSYDYYPGTPLLSTAWGMSIVQFNSQHPAMRTYKAFSLVSAGPDRGHNGAEWAIFDDVPTLTSTEGWPFRANRVYDPTNGTVSGGDIIRFGGEVPGFLFNK